MFEQQLKYQMNFPMLSRKLGQERAWGFFQCELLTPTVRTLMIWPHNHKFKLYFHVISGQLPLLLSSY